MAVWIIVPAFNTILACVSTDIINGVCIPLGVHSSQEARWTVVALMMVIGYIVPVILILGCYSRVVYTIRKKVSILPYLLTVCGLTEDPVIPWGPRLSGFVYNYA